MNSKLEKLAVCVKRTTSNSQEWTDPDGIIKRAAEKEKEDRMQGDFPYDDDSIQGVKEFYAGKDILITGGTGFIGKVLIEKILRSLPEGGRVFLLLRGSKGLNGQQRIKAMLELPLFELVMTENPEAAERLVAINADCEHLGLGLSPTDRQTLVDNVSIVFHCAASVRFDLTTNHMVMANVRATREVVYLCKELKKLESFVHVSTAFCNATRNMVTKQIPEEVIRQDIDWRTVLSIAEKTQQNVTEKAILDLIFKKLTSKNHTNNYTWTKALAEDVVEEEANTLPTIIVRPTVVIASYEDPFGGWVDNLYGPMSIWDGIGQGVVRTHYGQADNCLDYLPVDMNVKAILMAGWHRGIGFRFRSDPKKVDVINNGTTDAAKNKYRTLHEKMQILYDRGTHKFIFRYPRFHCTNNFWLFWLITVCSHVPLGILADTALRLMGKKPMLLKIYRKLYFVQSTLLHFFSEHEFTFDLNHQWKLEARMTKKEDKDRFSAAAKNFTMAYYHDNIDGIIKYVFREEVSSAEQSNRKIMYYLDWVHNALLALLGWWIVCRLSSWLSNTLYE